MDYSVPLSFSFVQDVDLNYIYPSEHLWKCVQRHLASSLQIEWMYHIHRGVNATRLVFTFKHSMVAMDLSTVSEHEPRASWLRKYLATLSRTTWRGSYGTKTGPPSPRYICFSLSLLFFSLSRCGCATTISTNTYSAVCTYTG